jgi:hypothetical protein
MSNKKKEKPIKQFRAGYISAAVWERQSNGTTFYNVSIVRSFKGRDGWKRTSTFDVADLPTVQALAEEAFRYCLHLQEAGEAEEPDVEEEEAEEADVEEEDTDEADED